MKYFLILLRILSDMIVSGKTCGCWASPVIAANVLTDTLHLSHFFNYVHSVTFTGNSVQCIFNKVMECYNRNIMFQIAYLFM